MFLTIYSVSKPLVTNIITRLSTAAGGIQAAGSSEYGASSNAQFSADGRYMLFESTAPNLVTGDTNGASDIFRKDLMTGAVERVSTAAGGVEVNGASTKARFSADGRYVIFESAAKNLVASDGNDKVDIFRKDLATGAVERLSTGAGGVELNGASGNAQFSADGRYMIFESMAANLVTGDANGTWDIFRKNLATGAVERLSTGPGGIDLNDASAGAKFSADGRYMIFASVASNLVPGDEGWTDIFRKDLATGAVERLSTTSAGRQARGGSGDFQISADGRYMVFQSLAENLVTNDTNRTWDIFRKNLVTGAVELLSTTADGKQIAGASFNPQFSADGRYMIFESDADDLVAGDTNDTYDLFRKDLATGLIERLSHTSSGGEIQGHNRSYPLKAQFSADGRYMVFESEAHNIIPGDTNGVRDIFRVDLLYRENQAAIADRRFLEFTLGTGSASNAKIDWGDGTSSSVTPSAGSAGFHHAYATAGVKAGTVTLVEGDLTWAVPHNIDVAAASMVRNTTLMDTLSGGAGKDSLTGDAFANILIGNGGNDAIKAGAGNDRLQGGLGVDALTGSTGKDMFVFDDKETGSSKSKADTILDFQGKKGDRIDLKLVDADTRKKGDQKFVFIGKEAFTKAGQVRVEKTKKETFVYLNTDSDKAAEAVIKLKGAIDLSKGWFVL